MAIVIDPIARGQAKNAIKIKATHKFIDSAARDAYFTANPTELKDGIYVTAGGVLYEYTNNVWDIRIGGAINLSNVEEKDFKRGLSQSRRRKPIMSLVDDDGRSQVWDLLKPVIDELQVPITSCLITNNIGTTSQWLTLEQINTLKATGLFEFVSHTNTHPRLADLVTEEEIRTEMKLSKEWLIQHGLVDDLIVYPYGSIDARVRKIAREFFRAGVDIDGGSHEINIPPLKTYQLERVYLENQVEIVKTKIDEAVANNGWIIVGMHCHYANWSADQLREIVNYAKTKSLDIVTLSEGLNRMGNILDIGDTTNLNRPNTAVIDCDGNFYGSEHGKIVQWSNSFLTAPITNSSLPSAFQAGKITIINITSAEASSAGFPENKAGTLFMYRLSVSSDAYTYQEFWVGRSGMRYRRYYNTTLSVWDAWEKISPQIQALGGNAYPATAMPAEYPREVTIFNVTSGQTGFPSITSSTPGGTLINIKLSTAEGYQFQIFKEIRSSYMWTRYTRGGAWSAWEQMNSAYSLPVNSVTATSPITDFKIGFTITYVNDAGATGFPDNIGGILTTYRQSTTNGWSYQEYKKYNSWDKYIRYCDTSGVWSEWKQFTLV